MFILRVSEDASMRGGGQRLAVRCNFVIIFVVLLVSVNCYMLELFCLDRIKYMRLSYLK
jgi:hypothetical protein